MFSDIEPLVADDHTSVIPSTKEILVTGESKMSARMMKTYFKKSGKIEKVTEMGDDKLQFVVTFANAEGMCYPIVFYF